MPVAQKPYAPTIPEASGLFATFSNPKTKNHVTPGAQPDPHQEPDAKVEGLLISITKPSSRCRFKSEEEMVSNMKLLYKFEQDCTEQHNDLATQIKN
jgi:hypothetical protein